MSYDFEVYSLNYYILKFKNKLLNFNSKSVF